MTGTRFQREVNTPRGVFPLCAYCRQESQRRQHNTEGVEQSLRVIMLHAFLSAYTNTILKLRRSRSLEPVLQASTSPPDLIDSNCCEIRLKSRWMKGTFIIKKAAERKQRYTWIWFKRFNIYTYLICVQSQIFGMKIKAVVAKQSGAHRWIIAGQDKPPATFFGGRGHAESMVPL